MTKISKNYKPTKKEKFMNAKMKEYFRIKLIDWKNELLKESSQTLANLQKEENTAKPDVTDRASEEIERSFELRTRDRERKLINKIDSALKRIEDGKIDQHEGSYEVGLLLKKLYIDSVLKQKEKDDEVRQVVRDVNELRNEMREIKNLIIGLKDGR